jgi:hypothetical protein
MQHTSFFFQDGLNHLEMTYAWNNIILPGTGTWQGADPREKHFSYDLVPML